MSFFYLENGFDEDVERNVDDELRFVISHGNMMLPCSLFGGMRRGNNRNIPTHTEDGIPIRKLYVSHLPIKTTRTDLLGVFVQFGHVRSCWLHNANKQGGPPGYRQSPTYGFVTFASPADAHKALVAPGHKKLLKGKVLKTLPADSWHQPKEGPNGQVIWNANRKPQTGIQDQMDGSSEAEATSTSYEDSPTDETEEPCTVLDILNHDCLINILQYIPIRDLIRSERVSKRWRLLVQEYLQGIKIFKTSSWDHSNAPTLTTAVLRQLLTRLGTSLVKFHIDHSWSRLNDRTAHVLGKFCPQLEDLKVFGMPTKNWRPVLNGCKKLHTVSFLNCNKLTDISLMGVVNQESSVKNITIKDNSNITGQFLAAVKPKHLESLCLNDCFCLQDSELKTGLSLSTNLKKLHLDLCPMSVWFTVPSILKDLTNLEELSLSDYSVMMSSSVINMKVPEPKLEDVLGELKCLKVLRLTRNTFVNDNLLKKIGQLCTGLEVIDIAGFNSVTDRNKGVSDEGVRYLSGLTNLRQINISSLAHVGAKGVSSLSKLKSLTHLYANGISNITNDIVINILKSCTFMQMMDLNGCSVLTNELLKLCGEVMNNRQHILKLYVGGTDINICEMQKCDKLSIESNSGYRRAILSDVLDQTDDGSYYNESIGESDDAEYDMYYWESISDMNDSSYDETDDFFEEVSWGIHPQYLNF